MVEHQKTRPKAADFFEGFYTDAQIEQKVQEMAQDVQRDLARLYGLPIQGEVAVGPVVSSQSAGPRPIVVNGKEHQCARLRLSYDDVVVMAYGKFPQSAPLFTVTYRGIDQQGSLTRDEHVWVETGMVFNVADTSNA